MKSLIGAECEWWLSFTPDMEIHKMDQLFFPLHVSILETGLRMPAGVKANKEERCLVLKIVFALWRETFEDRQ